MLQKLWPQKYSAMHVDSRETNTGNKHSIITLTCCNMSTILRAIQLPTEREKGEAQTRNKEKCYILVKCTRRGRQSRELRKKLTFDPFDPLTPLTSLTFSKKNPKVYTLRPTESGAPKK